MQVDDIYRKILRLLQDDSTRSVSELADLANMSSGPVWRRREKMEAAGIILGRKIEIDYATDIAISSAYRA